MTYARSAGVVAATLICVAATDVVACSAHTTGTRPESGRCGTATLPAPYTTVDTCSATAVLTAAATAVFGAQPSEPDPQGALESAAPLIDPGYLRRLGDSAVVLWPVSGATRARWAAAGVRVVAEVRITAEDHPADTRYSVSRVIAVDERPGNGENPIRFPVHMRTTRNDSGGSWLVDMIEVPA